MDQYPPFTAQEARETLLDFAAVLHERRSEISELRVAGVSSQRILNLYPFDTADYGAAIARQLGEEGAKLSKSVRASSYAAQPFGTVARHLPAEERRLIRAETRAFDRDLERVRAWAAEQHTVATGYEDDAEAAYLIKFTLTILHCLTHQPFTVGRNWTDDERMGLEAGLPLWREMTKELLQQLRDRA